MALRKFTTQELYRYNGEDGAPAFIAYQGKVYDVSRSFLWKEGRHQATHFAGIDLSGALDQAPHGLDLLNRFPVIGWLVE